MNFMSIISILFTAIISQNIVLSRTLGICPYLGVSKKISSATGMGFAVLFVLTISSIFCWGIYNLILVPLHITYLDTMAFILVIAGLVQLIEIVIKKVSPTLHSALGVYLPLITTNCAILGGVNTTVTANALSFLETFITCVGTGFGFLLAIVILACVRVKADNVPAPKAFKGFPLTLISAGIIALAFAGFAGVLA